MAQGSTLSPNPAANTLFAIYGTSMRMVLCVWGERQLGYFQGEEERGNVKDKSSIDERLSGIAQPR